MVMAFDWQQHSAKIAVAINRISSDPGADWETVRLVAESVADVLGRNPAFDRNRFLLVALHG